MAVHRVCLNCGLMQLHCARGICYKCFRLPGVKEKYPRIRRHSIKKYTPPEITEEELDAMIAEQMRNLPSWWKSEDPNL